MAGQAGEQAVEAEAGDDQVDVRAASRAATKRYAMSSRPIGSSMCHTIQGSRPGQILGVEHHGMVDACPARGPRSPRSPAPCRPRRSRRRRCGPPASRRPHARRPPPPRSRGPPLSETPMRLVGARLAAEGLEEALPQARRVAGLVQVGGAHRDVPVAPARRTGLRAPRSSAPGATGWMPSRQVTPGTDPLGVLDGLERGPVGPGRDRVERQQRLVFAREDQPLSSQREIERRVADPVAGQDEPPARCIPQRQGELARDPAPGPPPRTQPRGRRPARRHP